ncbi:septal ring lytic transglycosylase RlpA family protein [Oculatella sp. LEGE 06141]|uniref:septal ring lytic transglycosylase RlpA family protein n=1 Tax=Oculatella sp. LEGE 06141 TaxID=1828648 RepID=UPI00187DDF47|nr:septal ring lytic transglycosylase RlpA family protein [Oculatella sp. LEGE 06141]MBE9179019.1 septal ring lytic transglycosylase RlpA family protein [Oculatella sp. LEGE 06141]
MNQKLWSGIATAALIITGLGTAPSGSADQPSATDEPAEASVTARETLPESVGSNLARANLSNNQPGEAVKVGEYQSQEENGTVEEAIAIIQPHDMEGRPAATLYVRNIPVLTFLGSDSANASQTGDSSDRGSAQSTVANADIKVATSNNSLSSEDAAFQLSSSQTVPSDAEQASDPVWQATSIAARINQLHHDSVDAESITASWDAEQERFLIKIGDEELVEMNSEVILPDTTQDVATDLLQATNRLRRQIGDAPPLRQVEGLPSASTRQVAVGPIQFSVTGLASWYGPGFNGRRSASGEVFNQNAMTAAHRNLPFGTQVRVTNLNNGQSVVVRINDRGPFSRHRIIDLSAGAARAVGLMQAGVAPVSVDVIGTTNSAN